MPQVWIGLFVRLALLAFAGLAIGWLYGEAALGLLIACVVALGWQLVWLYRLDRWLHGVRMEYLPEGSGVWPQAFAKIDFIKGRSRRRSQRFKELLKQMRKATKSFPEGGIILAADHSIVTMNHVAEELLGLTKAQDRGLPIEHLIRDPEFVAYLRQGDYDNAVEFASPDNNEHWLSCYQVPYGLDQKLLLIRDITQQRKVEEMRRDFVANASHELRTPLTVITGYLDALADDEGVSDDLKAPISEMQRQADRMRNLVEELLRLSELESESLASECNPVNISALINAARQEARVMQACPDDIEVMIESEADLCGDAKDIQSVISNLVTNAVRYTSKEGRIAVRWETDEQGGYLSVEDTGIGVPGEHIPRLTERFYRVEHGRERIGGEGGAGLGLAIVKHALNRHSAELTVESEAGKGSKFICHFPNKRIVSAS